jgi:hypothetical protein
VPMHKNVLAMRGFYQVAARMNNREILPHSTAVRGCQRDELESQVSHLVC